MIVASVPSKASTTQWGCPFEQGDMLCVGWRVYRVEGVCGVCLTFSRTLIWATICWNAFRVWRAVKEFFA